jgi:modification methylase
MDDYPGRNMKTSGTKKKNHTQTSAFGSPGRSAHDASRFYQSRIYAGEAGESTSGAADNEVPSPVLDRVFYKSSEKMAEIPDNSVHLMVTSPPYNASKEYDKNLTLEEYRELLKTVFTEVYRILVTGGRACINLANLGRKPYIPLHGYVIQDMLNIGYLMRGEIIWNKASSAGSSTAWGTWRSATNPVLRDIHEYILVFSKGSFKRTHNQDQNESTISRDEFLEFSKSVWTFPAEPARRIGHPAPFPIELPYRLIQLYTYQREVVLDPFCGSGTTCLAAIKTGRHYIGYENIEDYVKLAEKRIREFDKNPS